MNKRKKMDKRLLICLAVMIVGLLIMCIPLYEDYLTAYKVEQNLEKVEVEKPVKKEVVEKKEDLVHKYSEPIPTEYDNDSTGKVVGKIFIPDVDIKLPIYKGLGVENGDNMLKGAVTNKKKQEMGKRNYVLSSHNNLNNTLFSSLEESKVGEKVYITDEDNIYEYKIVDMKVVTPDSVSILDDVKNKNILTLYTCTSYTPNSTVFNPDDTDRNIVTAELVNISKYKDNKIFKF